MGENKKVIRDSVIEVMKELKQYCKHHSCSECPGSDLCDFFLDAPKGIRIDEFRHSISSYRRKAHHE